MAFPLGESQLALNCRDPSELSHSQPFRHSRGENPIALRPREGQGMAYQFHGWAEFDETRNPGGFRLLVRSVLERRAPLKSKRQTRRYSNGGKAGESGNPA